MKKIKLFALILLMVFIAIPVFAQSNNTADITAVRQNRAQEEKGVSGSATSSAQRERIRQEVKNKLGKTQQFKSNAANEHRSAVANFVQNLLDVADRQALGGIGEQVREIARQQNSSEDKVTPLMEKIKNKNKIRKFFFGTDFQATKEIKKEMFVARQRLNELEKAKDEIVDPEEKANLEEQIKNFQDNVNNVLSEVQVEENKFSLFGWVKKFFIK